MDSGRDTSEESHPSTQTSAQESQGSGTSELSPAGKREKGRVRFNSIADVQRPPTALQHASRPKESRDVNTQLKPPPRPSLLRGSSYNSYISMMGPPPDNEDETQDPKSEKAISARDAQERAQQIAATVLGSRSAPDSTRTSLESGFDRTDDENHPLSGGEGMSRHEVDSRLANSQHNGSSDSQDPEKVVSEQQRALKTEAYNLVRSHTIHHGHMPFIHDVIADAHESPSGQVTPTEERDAELYVPPPPQYRGSILSNLLKLYKQSEESQPPSYPHSQRSDFSEFSTPGSSGRATPTRKKWYDKEKSRSTDTLANLVEASARLADVTGDRPVSLRLEEGLMRPPKRPKHKRTSSGRILKLGRPRMEEEIRITINIAETLSRQKYIIKMCKALMMYGAPTHRLEEYLTMTARVLEIDGQFLYLPGCMIISFDDKQTHTTEVKIVRTSQGIDLGKLKDIHEIYKSVLHDLYGVDAAMDKISLVMAAKDKFHPWFRVFVFGLASAAVAPFAFGGRWVDLPICFLLGSMVGALQIIVAPKSSLYNNLFEISATILTSFLARAFGSIRGGELFCFSALAQSSIALILPGWFVRKFHLIFCHITDFH